MCLLQWGNIFPTISASTANLLLPPEPVVTHWACSYKQQCTRQKACEKKMKLTNAVAKSLQESVISDGFLPNAIAKLETARLHIQVQFYTLDSVWGKLDSAAIKKSFSSRSRKTLTLSLLGHVSGLAAACFGHNTASTHTVHSMHRTRCSAECITVHKSSTLRMAIKCIIYIY